MIEDAVKAWRWLCDPKNTYAVPDSAARSFGVSELNRGCMKRATRKHVDAILELMEIACIVGPAFQTDLKGTKKEMDARVFNAAWQDAERETEVEQLLAKAATAKQAAGDRTSADAEREAVCQTALAIYDWITDPENFEMDHRGAIFSVIRLCRDLAIDVTAAEEALSLLEQRVSVIGSRFTDLRGRKMHKINREWLEPAGKQRLIRILNPEAPKPHVPFGPARVLRAKAVYIGPGQLRTFLEGDIVRDECHISALLASGAVLAKLEDADARMCAIPKCGHRYNAAESPALDFQPLEVLGQRMQFSRGAFTTFLTPGELVADRQTCLFIQRTEWLRHYVRELDPQEISVCPRCNLVSRRSASKMSAAC